MARKITRFVQDRSGGVLIVGAITLPIAIGAAALATEFGFALANRVENQRVADLASYAGAIAYGKNESEIEMLAAAQRIAQLNGLAPGNVSASLVASPRTEGASAVSVTVTTQKSLVLAPVLGFDPGVDIAALAMAELGAAAAPSGGCIIALQEGGAGLVLSGGTGVTANNCEVSSNSVVTVPCGTSIRTPKLNYNSNAAPSQPCNGIQTPTGGAAPLTRTVTPDPLANHTGLQTLAARLTTVAALAAPSAPTTPNGNNIEFGWNQQSTRNAAVNLGCTASWSSPTWTFTCPSTLKTVNIGSMTMGGGINVRFAVSGGADVTYNFASTLTTAGTVTFGPGTYNLRQGITVGGGSTVTFGSGTFNIGAVPNCNWTNKTASICNTSSLTIAGPSKFNLSAGIYNSGGGRITLGSGNSNSYRIGPSTAGHAFDLGGGSTTILEDATAPDSKFEVVGNINAGGGGSCLALPAATNHDVKGNLNGAGALILGNGIWALDGYMHLGASNGGSANCKGQTLSVRGESVSIIVSGKGVPSGGTCANRAFCVAAGYSGIVLKAPTSGDYRDLAFIGPQSSTVSAGALFAGGANGSQISGAFYFPHGPIMMDGGASAAAVETGCLTLIGTTITLKGGTSAVSQCAGLTVAAPSGSGRVSLVR